MTRVALLLRGVNVGTRNRIRMPALAEVVERCGGGQVRTHLQSGNAVADWAGEPAELAERVRAALVAELGLAVPVLARTHADLVAVTAAAPFGEPAEPKLAHVAFLTAPGAAAEPGAIDLSRLEPARFAPDEVWPGPGVLYLRYDAAVQGSRLTIAAVERRLGVVATARNWTTVTALRELAAR